MGKALPPRGHVRPRPTFRTQPIAATRRRPSRERPLARVLICEDDPPTLLQTRLTFEQLGCAVETEVFGDRLGEKLRAGGIDLVLLDYQLAAANASELWPRLSQWERISVPTVMMSADDHRHEAAILGCLAFYDKPITLEKAREILTRFVVGGSRARTEASALALDWAPLPSWGPAA